MHEYLGFTPNLAHAFFNGVPSLKSIFFPPADSSVMCRPVDVLPAELFDGMNAVVDVKKPHSRAVRAIP